jgi:hypothetical protein
MSDEERQAQSKLDPPVAFGTGLTRPIEDAPSDPDVVLAEAPDPDVVLAEAPDSDERAAQVKAVPPYVASPAAVPPTSAGATPVPALGATPASAGATPVPALAATPVPAAQVKAVTPAVVSAAVSPASGHVEAASPPAAVPTATAPSPAPIVAATLVPAEAAHEDDADYDDAAEDEAGPRLTFADRLRHLSPPLVILSILSIGSLVFLALAITSHTTPVPVLLSSAVVTGLAFAVDAVVASFMTWRAGQNGQGGKALLLALVGGTSAVIAAGAFAGTLILALLLKG